MTKIIYDWIRNKIIYIFWKKERKNKIEALGFCNRSNRDLWNLGEHGIVNLYKFVSHLCKGIYESKDMSRSKSESIFFSSCEHKCPYFYLLIIILFHCIIIKSLYPQKNQLDSLYSTVKRRIRNIVINLFVTNCKN